MVFKGTLLYIQLQAAGCPASMAGWIRYYQTLGLAGGQSIARNSHHQSEAITIGADSERSVTSAIAAPTMR